MKIIISGGDGQLAYDCNKILGKKHTTLPCNHNEMDISDYKKTWKIVNVFKPDIIVNCAAFTQVDLCEREKESAIKANVNGTRHLAEISKKLDCKLIQISTDYVFNGKKRPPENYLESDQPGPLTFYGKTKLDAELAIKKISNNYAIIRTGWLYGIHGHNFLKSILKICLSNPQKKLKVVNDQFGSLTWTYRLAEQIEKIIESNGQRTYHATSEGYSSWFEAAEYFLQKMKISREVISCTTADYPTPACRPANSILENHRLKNEGINVMNHWKSDLDTFVSKFRGQLIKEANEIK